MRAEDVEDQEESVTVVLDRQGHPVRRVRAQRTEAVGEYPSHYRGFPL